MLRLPQPGRDSVELAAQTLFVDMRTRIFNELEIHRFSFIQPSNGDLAANRNRIFGGLAIAAVPTSKEASTPVKNPGGKALAPHWDQMWAHIAVQLWTGDLKPTRQADISKAMFDWFNKEEIEVGQTAVTDRARALWLKIEPLL